MLIKGLHVLNIAMSSVTDDNRGEALGLVQSRERVEVLRRASVNSKVGKIIVA